MKAYDVTPRKKSGKFIQYYYELPFTRESERILDSNSLRKSSEVIIGLGVKDNGRVTRALHWFRRATKSTDLLERFTCLWIGLETINLTLCKHYGIEVEYSTCDCCKKNVPILTGVKKLLKDSGDKNLRWRKISKLRATTLHGSKQLYEIIPSLRETVPSLQDALYTGLILISGLDGSDESIRNIGSPLQGRYVSNATIEGPDLQLVDKVFIPRFDYQIGIVHLPEGKQEFSFEHKPVIDDDFKFENEEHILLTSPKISNEYTFEVDGQ